MTTITATERELFALEDKALARGQGFAWKDLPDGRRLHVRRDASRQLYYLLTKQQNAYPDWTIQRQKVSRAAALRALSTGKENR